MQKRRKAKNFSKSVLADVVSKLPQSLPPPRSAYYLPFKNIIGALQIHTLRLFLEEYRKELNISDWSPECLDCFVGQKLSEHVDDVISCCLPLGSLQDITRFLFLNYACQRARFVRINVHKIRLPLCRFLERVNDKVLMTSFVVKLNAALDRANGGASTVYKSNVYYMRKAGLSVFSVDRYDLVQPSTEAQFGIIYFLDAMPFFFVLPLSMPIDVIAGALQAALGLRLRASSPNPQQSLHSIIKEEAKKAGLRSDVFPDHLKSLLHFQANTLRHMVRKPELSKYPSQHDCSFRRVSLELTDGLEVSLKRRHHENLLESLYHLEARNRLRMPSGFLQSLATNSKNSFSAFELKQALSGAKQ